MARYCITFSPTGGTQKVADILKEGLGESWTDVYLISLEGELSLSPADLCMVAVPSFGGRVPDFAAKKLKTISGNGAKAILVCVYGNRAYEDTLAELQDIMEDRGFGCVGAVAALAEHSIMHEFAAGRPDDRDRQELLRFAKLLEAKLDSEAPTLVLPGNRPYKEYKIAPMIPQADDRCTRCGKCAVRCPVDAINPENPREADPGKCISCMACTAACPLGVRTVDPEKTAALIQRLRPMLAGRKDNETFI